jgi:hypothetical protein
MILYDFISGPPSVPSAQAATSENCRQLGSSNGPKWGESKAALADFEIISQLDKQNKQTCGFLSGFPTPIPPLSFEKLLPWTSLY